MSKFTIALIVIQLLFAPLNADLKRPCYKAGCKVLVHKMVVKTGNVSADAFVMCYMPTAATSCAVSGTNVFGCKIGPASAKNTALDLDGLQANAPNKKINWAIYINEHSETEQTTVPAIKAYKDQFDKWKACAKVTVTPKSTTKFEEWMGTADAQAKTDCKITASPGKYPGFVRPEFTFSWEVEEVNFDDQSGSATTFTFEASANQNSKGTVNGVDAWIGDYCEYKKHTILNVEKYFYFDKPDGFSEAMTPKTDFKLLTTPRWRNRALLSL